MKSRAVVKDDLDLVGMFVPAVCVLLVLLMGVVVILQLAILSKLY